MSDELAQLRRIRREQMVRNEIDNEKREQLNEIIDKLELVYDRHTSMDENDISFELGHILSKLKGFRDEEL